MEETFAQAYAAWGATLYRLAAMYVGSAAEAEDVLQDVFVKLLSQKRTFQDQEHQKRWLIRVTVNLCKDRLRSARRRETVPLEDRDMPGREGGSGAPGPCPQPAGGLPGGGPSPLLRRLLGVGDRQNPGPWGERGENAAEAGQGVPAAGNGGRA